MTTQKEKNEILLGILELIKAKSERGKGRLLGVESKIKDFYLSKPVNMAKHDFAEIIDLIDEAEKILEVD